MTPTQVILLTEGRTDPYGAKTATNYVRYKPECVVALLDSTQAGKTAAALLGVGGDLPVVASLAAAPPANTLVIGASPPGGRFPPGWRDIILQAVERGMTVVNGLHEFLNNDPELVAAAQRSGARLMDIRRNNERSVATQVGLHNQCLRVHTVGHDCNVGKMVVSLELARALQRRGVDTKFVATGQTGIMLEGDGCPIDCVVSDFVSGAAEQLVLKNQSHSMLMIEGQASLVHPMYSGVTLGLLHGSAPHGLVLCYEVGRTHIASLPHFRIPPLPLLVSLFETMANLMHPCKVIGIGINSRKVSATAAAEERRRVRDELGLPACDVVRDGPDELVEAILRLRQEVALQ